MTRRVTCAVTAAVLLLAFGTAVGAQAGSGLADDLLGDWQAQRSRLLAVADAMPGEKYSFKATPPQRTFSEQLHHLAQAHVRMLQALDPEGKVKAPSIGSSTDKAAVTADLTAAYDYGAEVIRAAGNRLLEKPAKGDAATLARTVWRAMGNAMNHYGQTVVYLRLNDIVPPASRR